MLARTTTKSRLGALVVLLGLVCGCNISPKPEPPSFDGSPVVDPDTIVSKEPSDANPDPTVAGGAGAVEPAEGVMRITNLDSSLDPDDVAIEPDGSFSSFIELWAGDEIRLQVITDSTRSLPFDFVVGFGQSAPLPAPRPLEGCLMLDPQVQLDLSQSQHVVVFNDCDGDVQIDAPTMRRPAAGWTVGEGETWPVVLSPGSQVTVTVKPPSGEVEEVFFIQVSDPQLDRRPITAFRSAS